MTKISVLMPIYNTKENHLRDAIESILTQTYSDFEFLILNDSPDNSQLDDIVASYKDKRIKYLKNEKNMGITPSRNKLLDMAKGKYLAVMDHDDKSLPKRFEKQVAFLDNYPDYGVVGCFTTENRFQVNDHAIKLALMSICEILHPASMIRKSVLDDNNIRYEEHYSPAEDYAMWCRLIKFTKFYNVPEALFEYRRHDANTSKTQIGKMRNADLAIKALVRNEYPVIYDEFLLKSTRKTQINLFDFIPFISIIQKGLKTKIKLFDLLPIFAYKTKIKYRGD